MKTINFSTEAAAQVVPRVLTSEGVNQSAGASMALPHAYHELDEVPVRQVDPAEQLERNLETLAVLQARLQFVMREVRYLMKV